MALAKYKFNKDGGFSLVEVMIATTLLAVSLTALAQLFAISVKNNAVAKNGTFTQILAAQKMEQLRGLTWGFDILGLPISDSSTNTARPVEAATGGTGLAPSPSNTLTTNVDGYVDYIDQFGNIIGGGPTVPAKTMFIRRWSVEPLPVNPNNTLILQVLVTKRLDRGVADTVGSVQRLRDEARLMTVKTRKAL